MKKFAIITAVIAAVFFSGCATTESDTSGVQEEKMVEKASEVEKETVYETVYIPHAVKETSYYSDGYIESYKNFTYDSDMNLLKEELYDSFDEIIESLEFTVAGGKTNMKTVYDNRGSIQSKRAFSYNGAGLLSREEIMNPEGALQNVSEYEYDAQGNKIRWMILSADGVMLSDTVYKYEDGLNTRIEIFDGAKIQEYFVLDYENGNLIRKSHYEDDGKLVDSVEYEYVNGMLSAENYLRANGSVSRKVLIVNDDKGNPVKKEFFDGSGELRDFVEYEYKYTTEQRAVN